MTAKAKTRHVAVRCVKNKALIASELGRFVRFIERQTGHAVRVDHTNGSTEFL